MCVCVGGGGGVKAAKPMETNINQLLPQMNIFKGVFALNMYRQGSHLRHVTKMMMMSSNLTTRQPIRVICVKMVRKLSTINSYTKLKFYIVRTM